jgi:hypothetical protein
VAVVFMFGGLEIVLAGTTGEITTVRPGVLRLYTNVITPNIEDDATLYTECALSGYSPIAFMDLAWTTRRRSNVVRKNVETLTYTFPSYAGPLVTVYGSYVTLDASFPAMLYADQFSAPFPVPLAGGAFDVDVLLTLRQLGQ